MASDPGSLVLDPFGGSGTTYVAAELTGRRWVGSELDCSTILERFDGIEADRAHLGEIHANKNTLFTDAVVKKRAQNGNPISSQYRLKAKADDTDTTDCSCDHHHKAQGNLFTS